MISSILHGTRRTPAEEKDAQIAAVRMAYWDGMAEDGTEFAAVLDVISASGLKDEPYYDHVKAIMLMLPAATLGHAVAFGLEDATTKAALAMFIDAHADTIRGIFADLGVVKRKPDFFPRTMT